jgi:hypothetical protein
VQRIGQRRVQTKSVTGSTIRGTALFDLSDQVGDALRKLRRECETSLQTLAYVRAENVEVIAVLIEVAIVITDHDRPLGGIVTDTHGT